MADEEDGEPQMSAECRVEALPISGADIAIDGLRLRLDIRIVPRSKGGEAPGADDAAMLRVVTAKLTKASSIPANQWAAAMVGVGTLLIALTVWLAGIGAKPSPLERATAGAGAASAAPPAPVETKVAVPAPAKPAAGNVAAPNAAAPPVPAAPAVEPVPGVATPRIQRVGAEAPQPSKRAAPPKAPAPRAERSVVAAAAPAPRPDPPAPQPVAQRPAARADMLDLFGDTK